MTYDVQTLRNRRADDRWNRLSMGDLFERLRWSEPDREILTAWSGAYEEPANARLTAAEADDLANRVAHAVHAAGVVPGDVVLLACENSAEALVTKIGLAKAGVTVAPINPKLAPDIVAELIALVAPKRAIVDAEFWPLLSAPFQAAGLQVLATLVIGGPLPAGHRSFAEFVAGSPTHEPDVRVHGDDIWQILFTSGSTAAPKGVMVSHQNTSMVALSFTGAIQRGLDFESELVLATFLPIIYHVGDGTLYSAILAGGRALLGRRFEPGPLARAIGEERVSALWGGSPQALAALEDAYRKAWGEGAGSTLRSVIFGWAPMAPDLHDALKRTFGQALRCTEIIGQTEVTCSHRFWLDQHPDLYRRTAPRMNYVGLPHPLMASAIVDAEDRPIPATSDAVGEGAYRSPALTCGYYRNPEATAQAMRGGWFHGGDAFQWGESNQRMLVDRFKDIVKSGGENVSSIRVESVLMQHPAVARAGVAGLPHPRWGEAVTAFVVLRPGESVTEEALVAFAKARLAGFEVPKKVVFQTALPETIGGKLQKHVLRAAFHALYDAAPERG